MKITIVYDNEVSKQETHAGWGFSCVVEAYGKRILFDTGAKRSVLLHNMAKLDINPAGIDEVFISHAHWDHTAGLLDFLSLNSVKVYIPSSCPVPRGAKEVVVVNEAMKIGEYFYTTGELKRIEQSLVVRVEKGLVIVVGCSHPGVGNILRAASQFGESCALIGGLHGFRDFDLIRNLELICPAHCTQFKSEIRSLYPEKYIAAGVGRVIEI
jgi:7,8-dihydropterin-6-yl-methyl-4-(beta-D-ribofuranosyl)aminobenzene 5'-phosphate synthase